MRAATFSAPALAIAVALLVSPLAAQRRELAIVAGPNLTGASGGGVVKSTARSGFVAGLSLRIPRSDRFSFQTELLLVQHRLKGERGPSNLTPVESGPVSDDANLFYAQLPMLLRFQRGYRSDATLRPFFVVGPYLGLRLTCRRDLLQVAGTIRHTDCEVPNGPIVGPDGYYAAVYQELDVGLLGEVGVERRLLSVRLRGEKSVRNLVDPGAFPTSPFDRARLWSASLALAYVIRVI